MSINIDIGNGVQIKTFISCGDGSNREVGVILETLDKQKPCRLHYVLWAQCGERKPIHSLLTREPLTLNPSISHECGFHGFIHDGKWVPA